MKRERKREREAEKKVRSVLTVLQALLHRLAFPLWLIAKSWNTKAGKGGLFKKLSYTFIRKPWLSAPAKHPARYGESLPLSYCLYITVSHYLALPLCIIFTSLAFQKSYLYESCIAGALVSLSFLGYETGASQPPHARLTSGLEEDVSHKIQNTWHANQWI